MLATIAVRILIQINQEVKLREFILKTSFYINYTIEIMQQLTNMNFM